MSSKSILNNFEEISELTILSCSDGISTATKVRVYNDNKRLYFFLSADSTLAEHLSFNPRATIMYNNNEILGFARPIKKVNDEIRSKLIDEKLKPLAESPLARWFAFTPSKVVELQPYQQVRIASVEKELGFIPTVMQNIKYKLKYWIRITRAPFFTAIIGTMLIGGAYAYWQSGKFNWINFILALIGMLFMHGSSNILNDAFDIQTDNINLKPSPFNGGSRLVQHLGTTRTTTILFGLFMLIVGTIIGLYIDYKVSGPLNSNLGKHVVLWIGVIGVIVILFYTAPPFKLSYRGLGDISIVLGFGVLPVIGVVYVLTQTIDAGAVLVSIISGLFVELILWVNSFPDAEADEKAGKRTLIVRLGIERSRYGYIIIAASVFILLIVGTILGWIPWLSLISILSLIILLKAAKLVMEFAHTDPMKFFMAMPMTIMSQLAFSILMSLGIFIAGILK